METYCSNSTTHLDQKVVGWILLVLLSLRVEKKFSLLPKVVAIAVYEKWRVCLLDNIPQTPLDLRK